MPSYSPSTTASGTIPVPPGLMMYCTVHRLSASRSLSPRLVITASPFQHRGCCFAQAAPSIGGPRVGQSALASPPVRGGGSVLVIVRLARAPGPSRGSARPVPAWGDGARGAQPVAAEGQTQGGESRAGETCPRAHTQSLVNCPFLGTAPGDGGGWGGRVVSQEFLLSKPWGV